MGLVGVSEYVALYGWSGGMEVFGSLETKTLCSRLSVILFSLLVYIRRGSCMNSNKQLKGIEYV